MGQVPALASLLETERLASLVQASLILRPKASSAATVFTGAVAAPAVQPSTVLAGMVPPIVGALIAGNSQLPTAN